MPRTRRSLRTTGVVACVAAAVLLSGCAGDPSSPGTSTTRSPSAAGSTTATPATEVPRPGGPAADISQRLSGGQRGVHGGRRGRSRWTPATSRRSTPRKAARRRTSRLERSPPTAGGPSRPPTGRATGLASWSVGRRPRATASCCWSGSTSPAGWTRTRRTRTCARRSSARATPGSASRHRRSGSRVGRSPSRPHHPEKADVPGAAQLARQGPQGHRPRALRVAAPPGGPVRLRHLHPGGPGPACRRARHRWRGADRGPRPRAVAVRLRADHLRQRRPAAHPRLRRVLRHEQGRLGDGRALGRQGRPRGGDDARTTDDRSAPTPTYRSSTCRPRATWPASWGRSARGSRTRTSSGSGRPPGPRTPTATSSAGGPPTRSTAGRRSTTVRCTSSPRPRSGTSWTG